MKKETNEKGITLIALVVTIVVLLILAGVSINMLTGQNGIINRAAKAKEETNTSQDLEYLQLKATEALTDYYQGNDTTGEDDYILNKWAADTNSKIKVNKTDKTFKYNGKTYAIADIIGNQSEKTKIEQENMKQITISNVTDEEDKKLLSSGKVRLIIEENDTSMRAAVPNGFYYVTGTPSTGLVISDQYGDDNNNTKGGNQFVWVPCSGDKGVTYEKENGLAVTWKSKYKGKSWWYNSYKTGKKDEEGKDIYADVADGAWSDNGGDSGSVKTYGGFYIARYEAGVPETASFYANKDGANYVTWNKNVETGAPVSKKNNQSWNFISQEKAVKVSANMYAGSQVVTSSLVDSYAWDTIVEWMTKNEAYKNLGNDSTIKGNYCDNNKDGTRINLSNALYAWHRYGARKNTSVNDYWSFAAKYRKGPIKSGAISIDATSGKNYEFENNNYDTTNYNYTARLELATGSAEETNINNIYDMAGNMWEWTTETGKPDGTSTVRAVPRGGGFNDLGSSDPVSGRRGNGRAVDCYVNVGFRVVLYIK